MERLEGGMRRCEYCGETFDTERAELRHLRNEHADELGSINRHRVASADRDGGVDPVVYAAGIAGVSLLAVVAYFVFFAGAGGAGTGGATDAAGSSAAEATAAGTADAKAEVEAEAAAATLTPHDDGAVHFHGDINVTIAGRTLDFSGQRYQLRNDHFHFENGVGDRWHVHSRDVTLGYAMETLGIDVSPDTLSFDGTTYRDADPGTTVLVQVNGDDVRPDSYVLEKGDTIVITVRTDDSN